MNVCYLIISLLVSSVVRRYVYMCMLFMYNSILRIGGASPHDTKYYNSDTCVMYMYICTCTSCIMYIHIKCISNISHCLQIPLPESVTGRYSHSLTAVTMSPHCVWLVIVGGYEEFEWKDVGVGVKEPMHRCITDTDRLIMIIELGNIIIIKITLPYSRFILCGITVYWDIFESLYFCGIASL